MHAQSPGGGCRAATGGHRCGRRVGIDKNSSTGRGRRVSLLRLANFPCGPQSALVKIGALPRVAVAQICGAGRGPLAYLDGCPCSASPVSAAGSGSAPQPNTPRCICRRQRFGVLAPGLRPRPCRGSEPQSVPAGYRKQLRSKAGAAKKTSGAAAPSGFITPAGPPGPGRWSGGRPAPAWSPPARRRPAGWCAPPGASGSGPGKSRWHPPPRWGAGP